MGIYTERKIGGRACAAILATAFVVLYGVWLFLGPELMRAEAVIAAASAELSSKNPMLVTIHGWATPECMPLLPAVARLLHGLTGAPMESVLRGLSILMLGAGALLVYVAASSRHSARAGVVAAAMYSSCFLSLGTAIEGTPATLNAFLLGAAQWIFFEYGIRGSDWNRAWIYSALLITLGFLSGGFTVLFFFIFPMFFFRRPVSVSFKFRRPGFVAAIVITALAVLVWWVSFFSSPRQISPYDMLWRQLTESGVGRALLTFPFSLVFWLLPWSLIAWLPFCAGLQPLDETPIYSRYLRTLAFSSLALLWLLPEIGRYGLFYALIPLSVLTGRFYEMGMRRYGIKLRRVFLILEVFIAAVALVIVAGSFLPETLLSPKWLPDNFISLDAGLAFRDKPYFTNTALAITVMALALAFYVHWGREREPAWMMILAASVTSALFFNGLHFPYRSQERTKRKFGRELRQVMPKNRRLYTRNIRNLNGGLFCAGVPVRRLGPGESFPETENEVWLLSGEFPQVVGYGNWREIGSFDYNGHPLKLWEGRRNERKKSAEETNPEVKPEAKPESNPEDKSGEKKS